MWPKWDEISGAKEKGVWQFITSLTILKAQGD